MNSDLHSSLGVACLTLCSISGHIKEAPAELIPLHPVLESHFPITTSWFCIQGRGIAHRIFCGEGGFLKGENTASCFG